MDSKLDILNIDRPK